MLGLTRTSPIMWQQLIFLHIPKTAGWALHEVLQPVFGEAHSLRINTEEDLAALRRLSPADFAKYRYISGHFSFADVKDKRSPTSLLVSIVRDPIRRIVSEFNYMSSWEAHPYYHLCKDQRFSEYVYHAAEYLRALQCNWLSGHHDAEQAFATIREHYALVGTVGNLGRFVAALSNLIGRDVTAGRTNVTPGQGWIDLDSRLCDALLDLTVEDRKLVDRIAVLPDGVLRGEGRV